jgi:hypothetical protein
MKVQKWNIFARLRKLYKVLQFPISSQIYILVPKFAHVMFTSSIVVKDELGITCGVCLIP